MMGWLGLSCGRLDRVSPFDDKQPPPVIQLRVRDKGGGGGKKRRSSGWLGAAGPDSTITGWWSPVKIWAGQIMGAWCGPSSLPPPTSTLHYWCTS